MIFTFMNGQSMSLSLHKFPPDIYYLLYGIIGIGVVHGVSRMIVAKSEALSRVFEFTGKRSYSLFFIHFLLVYVFAFNRRIVALPWPVLLLFLISGTYIVQSVIDAAYSRLRRVKLGS